MIQLSAAEAASDLVWHLRFIIDPHRWTPGTTTMKVDNFEVWATLVEGDPLSPKAKGKFFDIAGTLELDQLPTKIGSTTLGRFKLKTTEFPKDE